MVAMNSAHAGYGNNGIILHGSLHFFEHDRCRQ